MKQLTLPGIETRKQYLIRMVRENTGKLHSVITPEEHAQRELLYAQFKWSDKFKTH